MITPHVLRMSRRNKESRPLHRQPGSDIRRQTLQRLSCFQRTRRFLTAIHDAGFNVLVTANNHSLDRGRSGLERTILLIDSLNIPHAGTYTNAEEREKENIHSC